MTSRKTFRSAASREAISTRPACSWAAAASVAFLLATAACESTSPLVCTAEFVFGVSIEVTDSTTTLAIADSLSGTLVDGDFTEQMMAFGSTLVGAGEREGTYSATVAAPGYATWSQSDIVVTGDECHVTPVTLTARLQAQ